MLHTYALYAKQLITVMAFRKAVDASTCGSANDRPCHGGHGRPQKVPHSAVALAAPMQVYSGRTGAKYITKDRIVSTSMSGVCAPLGTFPTVADEQSGSRCGRTSPL
jgi:hypothetical protein